MRLTVYKSLDKPSSIFGIKGGYIKYLLIGVGIGVGAGVFVGGLTVPFIGFLVFVCIGVLSYMGVIAFQARFSEREKVKWMASRRIPDFIKVPPRRLSKYRKVDIKH